LACHHTGMTFALRIAMQLHKDIVRHRLGGLHPILRALYPHIFQEGMPKNDTSMSMRIATSSYLDFSNGRD
jgi:hypothetical protein